MAKISAEILTDSGFLIDFSRLEVAERDTVQTSNTSYSF